MSSRRASTSSHFIKPLHDRSSRPAPGSLEDDDRRPKAFQRARNASAERRHHGSRSVSRCCGLHPQGEVVSPPLRVRFVANGPRVPGCGVMLVLVLFHGSVLVPPPSKRSGGPCAKNRKDPGNRASRDRPHELNRSREPDNCRGEEARVEPEDGLVLRVDLRAPAPWGAWQFSQSPPRPTTFGSAEPERRSTSALTD